MPDVDFFNFWRWLLAIVGTIYATVITLQSLWGWYVWLAGSDKYISIVRQYMIVHGPAAAVQDVLGRRADLPAAVRRLSVDLACARRDQRPGVRLADVRRIAQSQLT